MLPQFKQDVRESSDFLQEKFHEFVDYLGIQLHEDPFRRAEEILENLSILYYRIFTLKSRIVLLFSLIDSKEFEANVGKLSDFDAYAEIKERIKSM